MRRLGKGGQRHLFQAALKRDAVIRVKASAINLSFSAKCRRRGNKRAGTSVEKTCVIRLPIVERGRGRGRAKIFPCGVSIG